MSRMISNRRTVWRSGPAFCAMFAILAGGAVAQAAPAGPMLEIDAPTGLVFSRIPAACFPLGATGDDPHRQERTRDERPRHEVCVASFWMATTEVTGETWARWMPGDGGRERPIQTGKHPAAGMTLEAVEQFLSRLNAGSGGPRYRLPTEAEWEHACRGGVPASPDEPVGYNDTALRKLAHYLDDDRHNTASVPVGTLEANAFGLFDMLGNVWEWTADDYAPDAYARHVRNNPRHVEPTGRRAIRGGSYRTHVYELRCGKRGWGVPGDRLDTVGLRLVREEGKK